MRRFKPTRTRNGGFGHCTAKYSKHPGIQHGRALEGQRAARKRAPIKNPCASVPEAIAAYRPPGKTVTLTKAK